MDWKVGDRAVTKGISAIIEKSRDSFNCKRCGAWVKTNDLSGKESERGVWTLWCLDCLQPADREEKVRVLIDAAKNVIRTAISSNPQDWHDAEELLGQALIDLGEEV